MKNVLKVFAVVLVVFCMMVSCSKKASSSGSGGGSSNDTASSSGSSGGSSSAAAVSSDNSLKNVVGRIEHGKDDTIFNNWAGIPWAALGLSAAPSEPAGGKLETAFLDESGIPYIFISNVSRAAYENLCHEIEAGFNKEGDIGSHVFDPYLSYWKFDGWNECYEIFLSSKIVEAFALHNDKWEDSQFMRYYTFRIYYYGSPVNGVVMTIFSEAIL